MVRFKLNSAGCFLKINIFSLSTIGKTASITGAAEIRMSNSGFFKSPEQPNSLRFISKEIDLFTVDDDEVKYAGYLSVNIRFIFDKLNVVTKGPYLEVMPQSKVEQDAM